MLCRKCKRCFSDGSEEHIILEGLGGKTKTSLVFCRKCNESFSHIDKTLVEQFSFAKNLLEIHGKRGTAPHVKMTDPSGNPVMLKPGGKPFYLEPRTEEIIEGHKKTIRLSIPPHIWAQYKSKVEKQHNIEINDTDMKNISERPVLDRKFGFGGLDAFRAAAKMAYSLVCDHLVRHSLDADLSAIEDYIFTGTKVEGLCLFDDRSEIYEEVDDLCNIIAVHFNSGCDNIVGSITILGSFGFSVLLSRNYSGESYTIRIKNNPLDSQIKDEFERTSLERVVKTPWLLSRPNFSHTNRWISMGQAFSEKYVSKVTRLHYDIVFEGILANCMKQAGFYDDDREVITDEMIAILSACVARKITTLFKKDGG